jgi:hypothetical protein
MNQPRAHSFTGERGILGFNNGFIMGSGDWKRIVEKLITLYYLKICWGVCG